MVLLMLDHGNERSEYRRQAIVGGHLGSDSLAASSLQQ
jgi:hypothetical protein